eukprot:scaffold38481_cov84-Phaeocystis_antarctica.AAC.3
MMKNVRDCTWSCARWRQVGQWLTPSDGEVAQHQHAELRAEARARQHVALPRLWRWRWPAGGRCGAGVRLAVPLAPLVEQRVHAFLWREVGVDEVEHEFRNVGVGWWGIANRGEVLAHRVCLAEVRDAPHREQHAVVESREDGGGRLEAHDHDGRGRVDAAGRLVQEEHRRPLSKRHRDRQPPLVAAGQASHELVARLYVLLVLEADALDEVLDRGVTRGGVQLRLVQPHGVHKVVLYGERRPEGVELLDGCRRLVVLVEGERSAVDANVALRHAALLLERQHIEQRRLARARWAQDGQHAARVYAAGDVV